MTGADGYLWMLGTYPCETSTCPVLMRSTDGGKSWARVGTPPPSVDTLVFANGEDGYAYFQGSATEKSVLYWTGDSGKSWRLAPAVFQESQVLSVVTTEGHAYVLADEHCVVNRGCKTLDLGSSAVTDDTWTIRGVPIDTVQYNVDLAAFGSKVWLFVVSGGGSNAKVLVSDDGGASFTNLPSTGMEGLSCRATATSATTLWAFCATGLEGGGLRSTDGGRVFERLSGWKGASPNGADILPVSDSEAVYLWGGGPYMYLTRDGGRKFSSLWRRQNLNYGYSIAFADKKAWVILGVNEGPSGNNLMWRTTNGGHTWQSVKAPTVKATTSTATPSGVVTGQTADCTAFSPPVKVSLYSGTTFVASVTVPAGTSYRFVVAPGSYWLTGLDGAGASGVTVRAGWTVTVNSPLLDCQ